MPLIIGASPNPLLGYTRQANWLSFSCDDLLVTGAPPALWQLTFTSGTSATTRVDIELPDRTISMYGTSAAVGDVGNEFSRDADPTISATNFVQGCLMNPYLAQHFVITSAGPIVYFAAKQVGLVYGLVGVTFVNTTGTSATSYPGIDPDYRPNYSANIRVWLEDGYGSNGYSTLVGEFSTEPAISTAGFDLGGILNGILRQGFQSDMLGYGATTPFEHYASVRRYLVQYWDRYGTTPADRATYWHGTPAAPLYAWYAGPQRQHSAAFDTLVNEATDPVTYSATAKWLTYRNRGYQRRVTATEQHSLSWYAWWTPGLGEDARLQARITYTDPNGSNPVTTSWSNRYVYDPVVPGMVVTFPVGYAALNLGALLPVGKVMQRYDVRLFAPGPFIPLTEELSFHLAQPDYNELHLLYWSSLGATESLRTTGAWVEEVEAANLETYRPQYPGSIGNVLEPQYRTVPGSQQRTLKVFTGYVPLREKQALLDILTSPAIRLVEHDRQRHVPVRLLQGKAVRGKRGTPEEHLHGLELELLVDDPTQLITEL